MISRLRIPPLFLMLSALALPLPPGPSSAQPWAPGQEPPPNLQAPVEEAVALERLRRESSNPQQRRRYLNAANDLLHHFWNTRQKPTLLFAGDRASDCGQPQIQHPMAFYCPPSKEIAMAMNLRRSVHAARGKSDQELLLLDFTVLAHEWGHHVNREQGLGPFRGGLGLTAKQEELAADWRTGITLGWLLRQGVIGVDDFTQTANLMFELGDYELLAAQHHGYPKERFQALTLGLASQIPIGQRLGEWTADTRETFSRPLPADAESSQLGLRRYEVRRFEINRSNQIATNLLGGLLGAASCLWGSGDQCAAMALQQGKGRADGRYTNRTLSLHCASGRFDVSDDAYDSQPIQRDGKGQAAVLAARDCPAALSAVGN
jgi:uncharacterized protein